MINYDDHPQNIRKSIRVTEFRRHMAHYIAMVRYGDDWVAIQRKGGYPVYLVSQADFDLLHERKDDVLHGPRDPETGKRTGRGLWYPLLALLARDRT